MAQLTERRVSLHLTWPTLLKVIAAAALVWLALQIVWIVLLVIIALVIAAGLLPSAAWLEDKGAPRWLAACLLVLTILGALGAFFVVTWTSLAVQGQNLGAQLQTVEGELAKRLPEPIVAVLKQSGAPDAATLTPYVLKIGGEVLAAFAAFVLAWILVLYLLIERDQTYAWVRGFVPAPHRARFDRTSAEARDVAHGFVVGNFITSACAGVYFFVWLSLLGIPAALLLALLAFVFDFIPVLGFYLSVLPAMAMAATQSGTLVLVMIPIYLSYDVIENYLLGPRVYSSKLQLSRLSVLLAFAVGAQLAGVIGAMLALPLAAIYPTIEKLWLRRAFGDDVVEAHRATTE